MLMPSDDRLKCFAQSFVIKRPTDLPNYGNVVGRQGTFKLFKEPQTFLGIRNGRGFLRISKDRPKG